MPAPNLAISLNATTDEVRDRLMPVNRRWPIAALLDAARRFPLSHGRRVTFEYVLLAGVNDSDADADRLPAPAARHPDQGQPHPLEPVRGPGRSQRPSAERIRTFQERLRQGGLAVYIRTPRGDDIDAACGQLARAQARTRWCRRPVARPRAACMSMPADDIQHELARARDLGHRHLRTHRGVLGIHAHDGPRVRPALSLARAAAPDARSRSASGSRRAARR